VELAGRRPDDSIGPRRARLGQPLHQAVLIAGEVIPVLAASTALGLEVIGELMELDVTELVGPNAKHNPTRRPNGTAVGRRR
jgi:hypothetical protein